jgi:hypothetical protein
MFSNGTNKLYSFDLMEGKERQMFKDTSIDAGIIDFTPVEDTAIVYSVYEGKNKDRMKIYNCYKNASYYIQEGFHPFYYKYGKCLFYLRDIRNVTTVWMRGFYDKDEMIYQYDTTYRIGLYFVGNMRGDVFFGGLGKFIFNYNVNKKKLDIVGIVDGELVAYQESKDVLLAWNRASGQFMQYNITNKKITNLEVINTFAQILYLNEENLLMFVKPKFVLPKGETGDLIAYNLESKNISNIGKDINFIRASFSTK